MATKPLVLKRKAPTRIVRKPVRGQMPLELKPRVRLATRRKRARAIGVIVALFAAGGLTWGASLLSYHERFVINDINVIGTQALSASAVESVFGQGVNDGIHHFISRANVFLFPRDELRERLLQELPLLRAVSFKRESMLSQALTIEVLEREPRYLWCNNECFFMDADGYVFMKATNPSGFLTFRGGLISTQDPIGQTFMRGRLEGLVRIVEGLKNAGFKPQGATIENERDIIIPMEDGYYVKATNVSAPEELGKNISLILASDALIGKSKDIEYLDMRFGNRVYYKIRGEETVDTLE